jgi:aminopeptidase N
VNHRLAAALVAVALVLGTMGDAVGDAARRTAPTGIPARETIGDPYFPYDGNAGINVSLYDVHDAYRFSDERLRGWTRISLTATRRLTAFDLDFLLHVGSVRLSTGASRFHRSNAHELTITPADPIPEGTRFHAVIRYSGHPARIHWAGESNWLAGPHEVVAMNEPHMAAWWFPANDHPLDKARMDLHITVPTGQQVIANGLQVGARRHGDLTTYHWSGGGPMATYLAFFAAGTFAVRRGTDHGLPWLVAVSRRLSPRNRHAAMTTLLRTPQIVHWLQSKLGRYPFHSTGGLITSLSPGFALENQTRPTYPSFVGQTTVVHELAHQWFGDSVSVHHWQDIWLNEGFATYMEHLWIEDHGGVPAATWLRQTYDADQTNNPIWDLAVADPGPHHIFDYAVYLRGAMTLQALRDRVGSRTFHTILRTWVRERQYGHGTTAQFEALATRLSRQDLDGFFDAWLHEPTRPAFTAANGL